MNREQRVAEAVERSGARGCVECGKCVAVCPMADMYATFGHHMSPRGLVQRALEDPGLADSEELWCCTECGACTAVCPEQVDCRGLIADLRRLALDADQSGRVRRCRACEGAYAPIPVLEYLDQRLKAHARDYLGLCPACRRVAYLRSNA